MSFMFYQSEFNNDISKWDVKTVWNSQYMFYNSKFDKDIHSWNMEHATYTDHMFDGCPLENKPDLQPNI